MKTIILILISLITLIQVSSAQELKIEKYCKKIKVENDKFDGEIKYSTPVLKQIRFIKSIDKGGSRTYMSISTIGSTPSTGEGVTLLLENGKKIYKKVETDVRVNSNAQFEHSAFFSLYEYEIELLKKYSITDAKLYIFEMKIKNPIQYRAYLICLDSKK
jgi:hypothetical protein